MLGQFGEKLSEYTMEKFRRRDVKVYMRRHIEVFEKGVMKLRRVDRWASELQSGQREIRWGNLLRE